MYFSNRKSLCLVGDSSHLLNEIHPGQLCVCYSVALFALVLSRTNPTQLTSLNDGYICVYRLV